MAGTLALFSVTAPAQQRDYKDTYTAADAGKAIAPAAALDVMLTQLEVQVIRAAEAMPAEKYGFAPSTANFATGSPAKFDGVRTFAQQATHLISANYYFYSTLGKTKPPVDMQAMSKLSGKEEIVAALKQSFAFAHTQIGTVTNANAFTAIEGADGMHTPATLAAFGVAHGYDHYGQMVEYLRMNGIVPSGSK
ncbi:DinB family protein [Terriglobus aquaticus]|uniref:DinB family protein n=1 Tax=Terriglobus aquaticus TaxID=940139 RepID=A0ABW9KLL0_9BACT